MTSMFRFISATLQRAAKASLLAAALAFGSWQYAAAETKSYELKAVFLFNFLDFLQWPDASYTALGNQARICVVGDAEVGKALTYIGQKKKARGMYALEVLSVNRVGELGQSLYNCHVLYMDQRQRGDMALTLSALSQRPVLTVSDLPGFADKAGGIEFITKDNKLGLRINRLMVKQAQLSVSPHLLTLSEVIDSPPREYPLQKQPGAVHLAILWMRDEKA
jgi:hypothetical protein